MVVCNEVVEISESREQECHEDEDGEEIVHGERCNPGILVLFLGLGSPDGVFES